MSLVGKRGRSVRSWPARVGARPTVLPESDSMKQSELAPRKRTDQDQTHIGLNNPTEYVLHHFRLIDESINVIQENKRPQSIDRSVRSVASCSKLVYAAIMGHNWGNPIIITDIKDTFTGLLNHPAQGATA